MKLTEKEKSFLKERIEKKIDETELYIKEMGKFKPETLEEYKNNIQKRWACERACERISEALVDLAVFIIRIKEISYNEEDEKSFGVLLKNGLIDKILFNKLHELRGMRDHLAHRYGEIDDEIVFDAIKNELEKDAVNFLEIAKNVAGGL